MGEAFDRDGNVLGATTGKTKAEVFEKLNTAFQDAAEFRIRAKEAEIMAGRHAPTVTIGRIVHYVLSEQDAQQIMRRRTDGSSIGTRMKSSIVKSEWRPRRRRVARRRAGAHRQSGHRRRYRPSPRRPDLVERIRRGRPRRERPGVARRQ